MRSYLSKQENEYSQAMKQAFKESLENGAGSYEQRKLVVPVLCVKMWVSSTRSSMWDALSDLVPFVQFKKREKYPWRSVYF